jgi:large repetitive protein
VHRGRVALGLRPEGEEAGPAEPVSRLIVRLSLTAAAVAVFVGGFSLTSAADVVPIGPPTGPVTVTLPNGGTGTVATTGTTPDVSKADLSVGLTSSPDAIVHFVGETSLVATIRNDGPSAAEQVQLTIAIPGNLIASLPDPPPECTLTFLDQKVICNFETLGSQDARQVVVSAFGNRLGTFTSTATATSTTTDPNPSNNTGSTDVRVTCGLCVTKTASADANVGDDLTYTIAVRNAYGLEVDNVAIVDTLPNDVTFVPASSSTDCAQNGSKITCTVGDLAGDTSASRTIVVHLDGPPGTITNTATATGRIPKLDSIRAAANDADATTTVSTATPPPVPLVADLELEKTAPAVVQPGDEIAYKLVVTNHGPHASINARVEDELPAGVTFVSVAAPEGASCSGGGTVVCNLGVLDGPDPSSGPRGATRTVTIVAKASCSPTIVNTAHVFDAGETSPDGGLVITSDPVAANNTATASTRPDCADLGVTKSVDPANATLGDAITYTIVVTNRGPAPARAVHLRDDLAPQVKFDSVSTTQGTCSGTDQIDCSLGNLGDDPATITIRTRAVAVGTVTNRAVVSGDAFDPDAGNNAASVTHRIASANVSIVKTATPDLVGVGERTTYTLTVQNHGPSDAEDVRVTDALVPAVALADVTTTQGSCVSGSTVVCELGTLTNGAVATVTITVVAQAVGVVPNTGVVSSSTPDPDPADNRSSTDVRVLDADVSLTKTDRPDPVTVGGTLVYTLTVANAGPSPAAEVRVNDTLPASVVFRTAEPSKGTCTGGRAVECSLGTLAPGARATVRITVTPEKGGRLTNTATATSATHDPDESNNNASATTIVTSADLAVALEAEPTSPSVGDPVTVTVDVSNKGPSPASGVTLRLELPESADVADRGGCGGGRTLTCRIDSLDSGSVSTSAVTLRTTRAGRLAVSAHVTGNEFDPQLENNRAESAATVSYVPRLAVFPSVGPPGMVVTAVGSDFPPLTPILLTWQPGLGSVVAQTDSHGELRVPVPVFPRDTIGPRGLVATALGPEAASSFDDVTAGFLVVESTLEPADFIQRG